MYYASEIMNICCLHYELGPARHTGTTPKAHPEPYTFFPANIVSSQSFSTPISHNYSKELKT